MPVRLPTRQYTADFFATTYVLAYAIWLVVRTPGTPTSTLIGEFAFFPLGPALVWAYWRNSRVSWLDRRTRIGWQLLALGALSLGVAGSAWSFYLAHFDPHRWPGWVDRVESVHYLFAIAAYLSFPNKSPDRNGRTRFLLDVWLTVVAGFVLAFYFVLRVWMRDTGPREWDLMLSGPLLDWLLFVIAAVGFVQKRDAMTRGVMGLLLAANTTYIMANYVYAGLPQYTVGDTVDALWFAAWVLRWLAARIAWHRYHTGPPQQSADAPAMEYRSSAFSYVFVAGAFVLLISQVVIGDREFVGLLAFSAALMAALLLFRQFAELRENRRLFRAQLAQDARFRSLVQHSSDIILVVDANGAATYVSPSAARVLGESAIVVGNRLQDLVPDDDRAAIDAIVRQPRPSRPLSSRMRTTGGEWRDVEIVWSDLIDDPFVRGIVLNCRDVTDRNELERHLQHAQKLDAVGHLAGGLAHDFNNMLTVIRGYTELLRADLPPHTDASTDLGHMEQAVDRAATVTRKLLAFSRRQAVQPTVLDLNGVLRDLQPLLRQFVADGVTVALDCDPSLWRVRADQGQIEQVVLNLVTNARDAMPRGGPVQIVTANRTVQTESPAIGPPPGEYVALIVSDRGTGMSEDVRARIFEPFFSTKPKDRGMGLGLAMVHGIVTGAGGHIAVQSTPGCGTTFSLLWPRTTEAVQTAGASPGLVSRSPAACTVLLVDDEFGVRTIARRFLEGHGYHVIEAADGHQALGTLAQSSPRVDLLLTDMVMPGMHAHEFIASVRTMRPDMPVVCMTGFAGEPDHPSEGLPGVLAIVSKPFSSEALLRAVALAHVSQ
jgi:PAS domain S-box-containing protein